MSRVRAVAGGGRAVEIEPERLTGWFERFATSHDGLRRAEPDDGGRVIVTAGDGGTATLAVPFAVPTPPRSVDDPWAVLEPLIAALLVPRRLGLILVRLGGFSVGVSVDGRVVISSTDRKQVHGRNKAGGWSQQRFARRREGQARVALAAAADTIARVLVPELPGLDEVVLAGDRGALDVLRGDHRLTGLFAIARPAVMDVPEPRRAVLDEAARRARNVEITVRDPAA